MNLIQKKYGVVQNFFQVTAPTAIFKGDADDLADVEDINRLVGINQNHVSHVSDVMNINRLVGIVHILVTF